MMLCFTSIFYLHSTRGEVFITLKMRQLGNAVMLTQLDLAYDVFFFPKVCVFIVIADYRNDAE